MADQDVPLRDYVDQRLADAGRAVAAALAAAEKRLDAVNEIRQALSDQAVRVPTREEVAQLVQAVEKRVVELRDDLSDAPTKGEVRAQIDSLTITVAALNVKVGDFISQQTIRADHYISREAFESFNREKEADRATGRRAMIGVYVAAIVGIASLILSIVLHTHVG